MESLETFTQQQPHGGGALGFSMLSSTIVGCAAVPSAGCYRCYLSTVNPGIAPCAVHASVPYHVEFYQVDTSTGEVSLDWRRCTRWSCPLPNCGWKRFYARVDALSAVLRAVPATTFTITKLYGSVAGEVHREWVRALREAFPDEGIEVLSMVEAHREPGMVHLHGVITHASKSLSREALEAVYGALFPVRRSARLRGDSSMVARGVYSTGWSQYVYKSMGYGPFSGQATPMERVQCSWDALASLYGGSRFGFSTKGFYRPLGGSRAAARVERERKDAVREAEAFHGEAWVAAHVPWRLSGAFIAGVLRAVVAARARGGIHAALYRAFMAPGSPRALVASRGVRGLSRASVYRARAPPGGWWVSHYSITTLFFLSGSISIILGGSKSLTFSPCPGTLRRLRGFPVSSSRAPYPRHMASRRDSSRQRNIFTRACAWGFFLSLTASLSVADPLVGSRGSHFLSPRSTLSGFAV